MQLLLPTLKGWRGEGFILSFELACIAHARHSWGLGRGRKWARSVWCLGWEKVVSVFRAW